GLHCLFVADEIVVDKIDPAAMPKLIKPVELGQHLFRGLDPRLAPVELDDVAELAVEGAATRELHADMDVIGALQQVETRDRAARDVSGEFPGFERPLTDSGIPGMDERAGDRPPHSEHPKL